MGVTAYYYKGLTPDQTQGLTEIYPTTTPKMILVIGHGIGERNAGDLAGCKESSGWGGWGNIKVNSDKHGVIQIYINTAGSYGANEYEFAVEWAKKKYPHLADNIWCLGHSLGMYGFGKYPLRKAAFCAQIAGFIHSAGGNFIDSTISVAWDNIIRNGLKVWGVTAVNDQALKDNGTILTSMFNGIKALDAGAHVIKTIFPATEWPAPDLDDKAHNAVLGRLTQAPMYYSKGNISLITQGIMPGKPVLMNLYQWMISNPRGSVYQDPTEVFTGPKYLDAPIPAPTPDPEEGEEAFLVSIDSTADGVSKATYSNGNSEYWKPVTGDAVRQITTDIANKIVTIRTIKGIKKTFGPIK
jgi:hypothetical protein